MRTGTRRWRRGASTTVGQGRAAGGQTTFGIRVWAYDAVGNKSAFATLTVVIDPPPPVS